MSSKYAPVLNIHVGSFFLKNCIKKQTVQEKSYQCRVQQSSLVLGKRAKTDQGVLAQRFVFTSRQTAVPLLWDLSSGSSGQESGQCVQAGPVMSHRSQRLISGGKVSQRRAFTKPKIASAKTSPNSSFSGLDQSVFVCSYFMNSPVAFLFLNLYTVVIANDLSQQTLQLISFLWCKQLKGIWLNNIQLD